MSLIKKLADIANKLDSKGLVKEADVLDDVINKITDGAKDIVENFELPDVVKVDKKEFTEADPIESPKMQRQKEYRFVGKTLKEVLADKGAREDLIEAINEYQDSPKYKSTGKQKVEYTRSYNDDEIKEAFEIARFDFPTHMRTVGDHAADGLDKEAGMLDDASDWVSEKYENAKKWLLGDTGKEISQRIQTHNKEINDAEPDNVNDAGPDKGHAEKIMAKSVVEIKDLLNEIYTIGASDDDKASKFSLDHSKYPAKFKTDRALAEQLVNFLVEKGHADKI